MLRAFALIFLITIILNRCAPLTSSSANTPEQAQAASVQVVATNSTTPVTGISPAAQPTEAPAPTLLPATEDVVTGDTEDAPVRRETFVLTGEQALEVAVFMDFIRAYNDGRLEEALAWLSEDISLSDCDYGVDATQEFKTMEFHGKSQAAVWLRLRIADQDQLIISRISNENPDPMSGRHVMGVEYSQRRSTALESLGFPEGIEPKLASKVVFEAGTALIQAFANSPVEAIPIFVVQKDNWVLR